MLHSYSWQDRINVVYIAIEAKAITSLRYVPTISSGQPMPLAESSKDTLRFTIVSPFPSMHTYLYLHVDDFCAAVEV